ncbi:MAG: hypothetical protein ACRDPH_16390 [Marmoricola sp.]
MKLLVEAGLVTREQRGKWAYYRVVPAVLRSTATALEPGHALSVTPTSVAGSRAVRYSCARVVAAS